MTSTRTQPKAIALEGGAPLRSRPLLHGRQHIDDVDGAAVACAHFEHPERFRIELQRAPAALARPGFRLTVDTADDLELIRRIQARLAPAGGPVELADAIEWLDSEPALARSNLEHGRKAG